MDTPWKRAPALPRAAAQSSRRMDTPPGPTPAPRRAPPTPAVAAAVRWSRCSGMPSHLDIERAKHTHRSQPLVDDVVVSRVEPEELEQAVEAVQQVAATLSCWQRVVSSRLQFAGRVQHPGLRPWDSSLRVASSKDCPLWCDDVALRRLAESEGIVTFGTYALYEVLALQQGNDWLPSPVEMKMRLLRAQIADVPISPQELCDAADDSDGPDVAVGSYLGRPFSWLNPSETFAWYQHRVEMMMSTSSKQGIPGLLFNAAHGLGWPWVQRGVRRPWGGFLRHRCGPCKTLRCRRCCSCAADSRPAESTPSRTLIPCPTRSQNSSHSWRMS